MSMPIKSKDLCEKCKFNFDRWCSGVRAVNCTGCEHRTEDKKKCRCLTVKKNTPCPFFGEADENEAD